MATPEELLSQSLAKLRSAKRVSGTSASYKKDNPGEYTKVIGYLDGGPRPSGVTTDMGMGLLLEEDARRAIDVVAPPPPPPGEPDPVGVAGNWNLVFRDEFDSLDLNVWTKCHFWSDELDCQNVSTGELMCYQAGNVYVSDGKLVMKAEKRTVVCDGNTLNYVSGMAQSGGNASGKAPGFNFQYGYAEARMQMPAGRGYWPGFWTAPQDYQWPPEIDIVEFNGATANSSYHTYHWADAAGVHQQRGFTYTGPNFTSGYHVFGIDWSPGLLVWHVDGVEVTRFASPFVASELMYLYLNLAVGGAVGSPDAATVFPSYCLVDYVRVWKRV